MRRNRLKELWVNRPTVLIPKIKSAMKDSPYDRRTTGYMQYLKGIIYLSWEVVFEGGEKHVR